MDELELLKKDWQSDKPIYPELSYDDIYKMLHAKSSSIVKWIFYISIIELSLGIALTLINPKIESPAQFPNWIDTLSYFSIPFILVFMYLFYKNYKTITTTDNVKSLINSILKTRRTVKYYVLFNLILAGIFSSVLTYVSYVEVNGGPDVFEASAHFKEYAVLGVVIVVATIGITAIIFGIYYLIYGILLKRLNKNYNELKKLEV
ncbi:hypothetical protein [Winogradskyella immobilis]|uniref:Uncharacterized protein n=1 Tax=Winogradskyella immobilis TaxID=2816852 RepID=A0ABS8ENQ2_9FLAO|nr:hypothetical protein [Winogradskyella immobilis]MCC1484854.1 hypothetical protein [Winogradskyella immobilis]MCG0016946.1 hypothetical protein [Winogradskyella immobilis]